ncbi:hypothetical protein IWW37_003736 [Coemansia sp. RSA 2050]|nr:hypothetical protein IWW37_003736 [Coemansia sp. RSA 2050]KAJ2733496.1 hypothetical protein IW152_003047 [Coemansia sp. BCRC 34962]
MKIVFTAIFCFAVTTLAQGVSTPVGSVVVPARQAPVYAPSVVAGQTPRAFSESTRPMLARLASYFDMSRMSNVDTTTPVLTTMAFDPTTNKITHLSMSVVQSGDMWYLPVCTVDSITAAGSAAAPPVTENCQYGIQMTPMPQNAMRMAMRVWRTLLRAIEAAAREPTRFWFGRPPTGIA